MSDPTLNDNYFIAHDGANLPIRTWKANGLKPQAIILAVHGFNDYSNFFEAAGSFLAKKNITTYAYDQRGFGAAPNAGLWPGVVSLIRDLNNLTSLIRIRHPETPLYLLGESMGGGVIMATLKEARQKAQKLKLSGVILSSPAVWGRQFMPWYQTTALWIAAHTFPGTKLTGRGLKIKASDNTGMLQALNKDPLIIKKTRIDAIYGLTNLMDQALEAAWKLNQPLLVLYGKKDEVIPKTPIMVMLSRLPEQAKVTRKVVLYDEGYHMLMRDLQAKVVWRDIINWIEERNKQLLMATQSSE
jgi:alpha-beta hydrolase superfamily lysophospholipase